MRLIFVGDGGCSSGFARVSHAVCDALHTAGHLPHILAINWHGDSNPYPYPLYHCLSPFDGGRDGFGVSRLPRLARRIQPDVVVLLNDPWNIPHYLSAMRAEFEIPADAPLPFPVVAYLAIDAKNIHATVLNDSALTHVAVWTDFAADELRRGGYLSPCSVIPLGVDSDLFHPMSAEDRRSCRASICAPGIPEDAFIVGYVGRNQYRKRLDLLIEYFAEWVNGSVSDSADAPPNAYLYLYVGPTGDTDGVDIASLARYYGVASRVFIANPELGNGHPEASLPYFYNAFDAFLTLSQSEGWCLPVLEAMACGVPCIVPSWAALGERGWSRGAAIHVTCTSTALSAPHGSRDGKYTIGGIADKATVIEALQGLYEDHGLRSSMGMLGRCRAESLPWTATGTRFVALLEEIVDGLRESVHAADEVTAPLSTVDPYDTHKWESIRQSYGDTAPAEWVAYCADCGIEDRGDPSEFPGLVYPRCEEMEHGESTSPFQAPD